MRDLILLTLMATCVGAGIFDSTEETRSERSTGEDEFEAKLRKGYNLLKNEPNEDDTVRFLEKLHNMEEEIRSELALAPQQSPGSMDEVQKYAQIEKVHLQPMGETIEEINENSGVDTALFQGDIILTKEQADEILDDIRGNESNRHKRQAFRDHTYPKSLWSYGVSYTFSPSASEAARRVFRKAAAMWSWDTCINFGEGPGTDRINVILSNGCWSYIGRRGGVQDLSLGRGCETIGTAAHEIGHALGLFHTQSRHDRDNYIALYLQNIRNDWVSQFAKQTEKTNFNYNLTYDFGSVMHYGATIVSSNRRPAMVPRDAKYLQTLGSHIISFYDRLMINMHYGCLEKCNGGSSATCENGGYPHPRDCSKCICPSGFGGRLCNERPPGCGKTLTATTSYQTLEDRVGEKGQRRESRDEFTMCYYWIQAPAGSTIEVILSNYTAGMTSDGCVYAGVEIKTGKDKRHTGYRFCAPENVGTRLVSTHNIVPVITYSRTYEATTVLRYRIASSGPVVSQTTTQATTRPVLPSTPSPSCKDSSVCPTLIGWNFCTSTKYEEKLRKLVCPESCGMCS